MGSSRSRRMSSLVGFSEVLNYWRSFVLVNVGVNRVYSFSIRNVYRKLAAKSNDWLSVCVCEWMRFFWASVKKSATLESFVTLLLLGKWSKILRNVWFHCSGRIRNFAFRIYEGISNGGSRSRGRWWSSFYTWEIFVESVTSRASEVRHADQRRRNTLLQGHNIGAGSRS